MDRASEAIEVGDHCTVTLSGQFTARWRDGSRTREGFDISGSPEGDDRWSVDGPYLFDGAEVFEPPR